MNHNEYRQTDHWIRIRNAMIAGANNICHGCLELFDRKDLRVHHLHYDSLGHETYDDLLVLCKKCHRGEHLHVPMLSWFSAYCPFCSHFIRKNSSWILMLNKPLEIRTIMNDDSLIIHGGWVVRSYDDEGFYNNDPHEFPSDGKKKWGHAKCIKKYREAKDKFDPLFLPSDFWNDKITSSCPREKYEEEIIEQNKKKAKAEQRVYSSRRHFDRWD